MGFFSRLFSPKQPEPEPVPVPAPDVKVVGHGVAGASYHQDAIKALGYLNPAYNLTKKDLVKRWPQGVTVYEYTFRPQKAELIPEPDNPEDPKAIKVVVDGMHVGYIKSGSCAHIHRLIREDRIEKIEAKIIGGKYKEVYCFDEYDRRAGRVGGYELKTAETPFGVRLDITERLAT